MSTLAEQIAAVKRAVWCYESGAAASPSTAHVLAALRDALATLEGMAAPGEMIPPECDPSCTDPMCPYIHQWTEASPQQPTQEAQQAAANLLHLENFLGPTGPQRFAEALALALDRFAAQRVTATPSQGDRPYQRQARRIAADVLGTWDDADDPDMDQLELAVSHGIESGMTAATDKARRDTLAEVEKWHWQRYIELRDESPRSREGLVSGIAGAHMAAHRESAEYFRALSTPQNPGDAAPESE